VAVPNVTIAITHYKRPEYLFALVASIREYFSYDDYEIWVYDDCSGRDVQARLLLNPQIDRAICGYENLGQGAALNVIIRSTKSPYIMLSDDDWLVTSGDKPLCRALDVLASYPVIKSVGLAYLPEHVDRRIRRTVTGTEFVLIRDCETALMRGVPHYDVHFGFRNHLCLYRRRALIEIGLCRSAPYYNQERWMTKRYYLHGGLGAMLPVSCAEMVVPFDEHPEGGARLDQQ